MSQIRFFRPAEGGEWHAYRDESAQALCGEATLSYNRDAVADAVPTDGALHDGCRQAIDAENPTPYAPHPGDAVTEATGDALDAEIVALGGAENPETGDEPTSSTDETETGGESTGQPETDTQSVTSDEVASVESVLGETPATDPPADQPPA